MRSFRRRTFYICCLLKSGGVAAARGSSARAPAHRSGDSCDERRSVVRSLRLSSAELLLAKKLAAAGEKSMCRNIRTLYNFEPPATAEEMRASALQFVRKLSGFAHPSKANQAAFDQAVDEVADAAQRLLVSLQTNAPPRDRAIEAAKAQERGRRRFARA